MEIPLELFLIKNDNIIFKNNIQKYMWYPYYVKKYNISNKTRNSIYILNVISYISRIYNIPLYIYPMHCGFACNDKKYTHGMLLFITEILSKSCVNLNNNIEQGFSTTGDLERYLTQIKKPHGLNKEIIVKLLRNNSLTGKELHEETCRIPSIKSFFSKRYNICLSQKNIWVECNGKMIMDKFLIDDICIYNSHKYFVFIFTYQGETITLYSYKKDINFPFIDIIKLLLGKNLKYADSKFTIWES